MASSLWVVWSSGVTCPAAREVSARAQWLCPAVGLAWPHSCPGLEVALCFGLVRAGQDWEAGRDNHFRQLHRVCWSPGGVSPSGCLRGSQHTELALCSLEGPLLSCSWSQPPSCFPRLPSVLFSFPWERKGPYYHSTPGASNNLNPNSGS